MQLSERNSELMSWSSSLWSWSGQVRWVSGWVGRIVFPGMMLGQTLSLFLGSGCYFLWLVLKTNNPPWTRLTHNFMLGNSRGTPASLCPDVFIASHRAERTKGFCFCCGVKLPLMWSTFAVNWLWTCAFWGMEEFLRSSPFTRCPLGHCSS